MERVMEVRRTEQRDPSAVVRGLAGSIASRLEVLEGKKAGRAPARAEVDAGPKQ